MDFMICCDWAFFCMICLALSYSAGVTSTCVASFEAAYLCPNLVAKTECHLCEYGSRFSQLKEYGRPS